MEDPVEYQLEGISQVTVKPRVGLTFARCLRSILRQDPDTIMVGEIRDGETASISIQAALTGHRVFSTLHTNTAVGAVNRLLDMGMEPYLAAALQAVAGQLLVRCVPIAKKPMKWENQTGKAGIWGWKGTIPFIRLRAVSSAAIPVRRPPSPQEVLLVTDALRQGICRA